MTDRFLFDASTIIEFFGRLDAELAKRGRERVDVVVVGGAALAIGRYRDRSTVDVDTVTRLDEELRAAIAVVAKNATDGIELTDHWINDDARPWSPVGMDRGQCEPCYEGRALTVLLPHAKWLFLMKLNRALLVDLHDMRALWPHTGFTDADAAAAAFRDAYPGEQDDPHMASFIQSEVIDR